MRWLIIAVSLALSILAIVYAPHYHWSDCRAKGYSKIYCFLAKAY